VRRALGVFVVAVTALAPVGAAAPTALLAVSIATGDYHTCALTSAGGVTCWGDNSSGEIGDGTTIQRRTPVPVTGLEGKAISITAGGVHSCALLESGRMLCWGWNDEGQLGIGPGVDQRSPVAVRGLDGGIAAISGGGEHTCVLTTAGGVKCWGHNNFGGLGDGTRTPRSLPVDVVGLTSGVKQVAAGRHFTCALMLAGGVECWGLNESGQLGDGTSENPVTPVDVIGLDHGVRAIGAFANHACALLDGGRVKCWGANEHGELGDGKSVNSWKPVDVRGLVAPAIALAPGGRHSGGSHTCVVIEGGGVECWGRNDSGQLGDGTTSTHATPVRVIGLEGAVSVAVGGYHSCALLGTGRVKCWGRNGAGQLGDGTTTDRAAPVDVVEQEIRDCIVPRVIALNLAQARAKLSAATCTAGKVSRRYSSKRKGRVLAQAPAAGTRLAGGARVALVVSKGRKPQR
jgi:alpha-tubulin suppressor-like RCC1 family protein